MYVWIYDLYWIKEKWENTKKENKIEKNRKEETITKYNLSSLRFIVIFEIADCINVNF